MKLALQKILITTQLLSNARNTTNETGNKYVTAKLMFGFNDLVFLLSISVRAKKDLAKLNSLSDDSNIGALRETQCHDVGTSKQTHKISDLPV